MINIKTKDEGDRIAVDVEMKGTGLEIVDEAFAILTDLPKRLEEINPHLLQALMMKFEMELQSEEEESDAVN